MWPPRNDDWYLEAVSERYLDWCKQQGIKPHTCVVENCYQEQPCWAHQPQWWEDDFPEWANGDEDEAQ